MKLAENLSNSEVFKRADIKVWYCRNCGHLEYGLEAPAVCPSAAIPRLTLRSTPTTLSLYPQGPRHCRGPFSSFLPAEVGPIGLSFSRTYAIICLLKTPSGLLCGTAHNFIKRAIYSPFDEI